MADKLSIAIKQDRAFARLESAMARIGSALGVTFEALPVQGRDRDLLQAERWSTMAENAERVANRLEEPVQVASAKDATPRKAKAETQDSRPTPDEGN